MDKYIVCAHVCYIARLSWALFTRYLRFCLNVSDELHTIFIKILIIIMLIIAALLWTNVAMINNAVFVKGVYVLSMKLILLDVWLCTLKNHNCSTSILRTIRSTGLQNQ